MGLLNGLSQLLGNAAHKVEHDAQAVGHAAVSPLQALLRSAVAAQPQGGAMPDSQNPLSIGRVQGTAVANNAADQQGFSPMFRNIVMGARPYVGQGVQDPGAVHNSGAGAEYWPGTNQIHLRPGQVDPYTLTHEGLHAAFQRKTPQAQASFGQIAQTATPSQKEALASPAQLGNQIYGGRQPLTEVHSYLPQFTGVGNTSPQLSQYYNHYFSNPNFYQQGAARQNIRMATNPPPVGQFSDWQEN